MKNLGRSRTGAIGASRRVTVPEIGRDARDTSFSRLDVARFGPRGGRRENRSPTATWPQQAGAILSTQRSKIGPLQDQPDLMPPMHPIPDDRPWTRGDLLLTLASLGLVGLSPRPWAAPTFSGFSVSVGVASGYPKPDGMVLSTRLAPEPLAPVGGMRPEVVPVYWEAASDFGFRRIAASGTAYANPEWAHSVQWSPPAWRTTGGTTRSISPIPTCRRPCGA